jgi:GT2 family glycosyltransferase
VDTVVYIIPFVRRTLTLAGARTHLRAAENAHVVLMHDPPTAAGTPKAPAHDIVVTNKDKHVTLLTNSVSSGYVRSVNRAARWVLENIDCGFVWVVNDDVAFVRGVPRATDLPDNAGLMGVLSNRAGYQSISYSFDDIGDYLYPKRDVHAEAGQYDTLLARTGRRLIPVPLVHGFCFGIGRKCLETIGLLDELAFGHGYGSDYDLSLRATNAGFTNFVHAGAFVWHAGATTAGRVKRRVQSIRADVELRRIYGEDYKRAKFVTRERLNRHLNNFVALARD